MVSSMQRLLVRTDCIVSLGPLSMLNMGNSMWCELQSLLQLSSFSELPTRLWRCWHGNVTWKQEQVFEAGASFLSTGHTHYVGLFLFSDRE